jgi:tRNA/rRNA methyltransferase
VQCESSGNWKIAKLQGSFTRTQRTIESAKSTETILLEIHFILYKPAVSGNVGAAARAIKTMGFKHLRLIDPCDHLGEEAYMMAHGSHDILQSARVYAGFEDAASDLDLVVCTTAKRRTAKHEYHSSREIQTLLEKKASDLDKVGLLFGTEESGLPNSLILKSDLAMSIPMAGSYPSLNLAQSVMITAYELSPLNQLKKPGQELSKSGEGWGQLKNEVQNLLVEAGIPEASPLYHRIMERMATLGSNDIPLFLSVLSRIKKEEHKKDS